MIKKQIQRKSKRDSFLSPLLRNSSNSNSQESINKYQLNNEENTVKDQLNNEENESIRCKEIQHNNFIRKPGIHLLSIILNSIIIIIYLNINANIVKR